MFDKQMLIGVYLIPIQLVAAFAKLRGLCQIKGNARKSGSFSTSMNDVLGISTLLG